MAGPDTKLSQKTITTDPENGYLHIIKPNGPGFDSFRISPTNLPAPGGELTTDKLVNQDSPITKAFDAGTKLESIDFSWIAGSPLIKIGLTLGGSEISLAELPVPNGDFLPINTTKIFPITTTVYISITGGTVNININYRKNYF